MTLIETLVAITILTVALIGPMALTMQSLSTAYYARDQIIASNLAQEAIEGVRAVRDANILILALNAGATCVDDGLPMHLLCDIPIGQDFTIDVRSDPPTISSCSGACENLKTDGNLYGYDPSWTDDTDFRRTVHAEYVGGGQDEIRVTATVQRIGGTRSSPAVTISENLYRWVSDGSGE